MSFDSRNMVNSSNIAQLSNAKHQKPSRSTQKLSDERLARKRALDREAQRSSRCKTKNHIALLESRIEALTRVQDNGDTKELIDQIEQQRIEIEALRSKLKSIAKLVSGDGGEEPGEGLLPVPQPVELIKNVGVGFKSSEKSPTTLSYIPKSGPDVMMLDQRGQSLPADLPVEIGFFKGRSNSNSSSPDIIEQPYQHNDGHPRIMRDIASPVPQLQTMYGLSNTAGRMGLLFSPDQTVPQWGTGGQCSPVTQCKCSKIKNFTSQLLSQCSNLPLQPTANQNLRDADIPIRAVLHGWHAVTRKYLLDPLWSMLRHADEV